MAAEGPGVLIPGQHPAGPGGQTHGDRRETGDRCGTGTWWTRDRDIAGAREGEGRVRVATGRDPQTQRRVVYGTDASRKREVTTPAGPRRAMTAVAEVPVDRTLKQLGSHTRVRLRVRLDAGRRCERIFLTIPAGFPFLPPTASSGDAMCRAGHAEHVPSVRCW